MDSKIFLKLAMASVFLQKGLTKNLADFAKNFNIPVFLAAMVIFAEIVSGLAYGFSILLEDRNFFGYKLTQWASLGVIPVLLGAIALVHWKNGWSVMNNGFEYQFVLLMIAFYFLTAV